MTTTGETSTPGGPARWIDLAVAGRHMQGEQVSGDMFHAFGEPPYVTCAMIDGAGHGPQARQAAERALDTIGRSLTPDPTVSLDRLMRACHVALGGTRGAPVGLLRLHAGLGLAWFCGVGNIALHRLPSRKPGAFSLPGTVGYRLPAVRVFELGLSVGDLWALSTDGLSSRMTLEAFGRDQAAAAAHRMLTAFGRTSDDATVAAIRVLAIGPPPTTPVPPR